MEREENEHRMDLTPSEKVEVAKRIEGAVGKRQGQRTDLTQEPKSELRQNFAQVDSGTKTSEIAARAIDMNRETYRQAKAVVESGDDELIHQMDTGEKSIHAAYKSIPKPEPIKTHQGLIIDGRNRYKACLEAEVEPNLFVFVRYSIGLVRSIKSPSIKGFKFLASIKLGMLVPPRNSLFPLLGRPNALKTADNEWNGKGSLISHVVSLNLNRRDLTRGQRAAIGLEIEEMLAKEAAKMVGTNPHYITDAKAVKHQSPDFAFPLLKEGKIMMSEAKAIAKQPKEKQDEIAQLPPRKQKEVLAYIW